MTVLTRIRDIFIGYDSGTHGTDPVVNDYYTWKGIKEIKLDPVSPWVHTNIPSGEMLHQQLKSTHIIGEITVHIASDLESALYSQVIDGNGNFAVSVDTYGYTTLNEVDYFVINGLEEDGTTVRSITLYNFRVETIHVKDFELGKEAAFVVKFSADGIDWG